MMKKTLIIPGSILCVLLAVYMCFRSFSRGPVGVASIPRGFMMTVMCSECNAFYEVDEQDYYEVQAKNQNVMSLKSLPLTCKECGKESVYRAVECPKCGNRFFWHYRTDYPDKCPKCGYSKIKEEENQM